MLNASNPTSGGFLHRTIAGLLAYLPSDSATWGTEKVILPTLAALPTLTVSGYAQRAITMWVGFGAYNAAADDGYVLNWNDDSYPTRAIILSSKHSVSAYDAGNSLAIYAGDSGLENTTRPGKMELTPDLVRGWNFTTSLADGVSCTGIPPVVYPSYVPIYTARFNQDPGQPPGIPQPNTRYDVYWSQLCFCRDNTLVVRNLPQLTSLRVTVGAFAPVTYNANLTGRIVHNFLGAMFPARVVVELFALPNAAGKRLARQVLRCYGGDEYAGTAKALPPIAPPGPPFERAGWIATAARAWSSPADALDGSLGTRYANGTPLTIGTDYWRVDMLAPQLIGTVRVQNIDPVLFNADVGAAGLIQTSLDGLAWTTAATYTTTDDSYGYGIQCSWSPVLARYVQVVPTIASVDWSRWFALHECDVYATTPA